MPIFYIGVQFVQVGCKGNLVPCSSNKGTFLATYKNFSQRIGSGSVESSNIVICLLSF